MLLCERGRAVDQYEQLDDVADFVEIADGSLQRGQQVDRDGLRGLPSFRDGQIRTEFAGPGLAVFFGNVPGDEDEVAGTDERNKGGDRRGGHRARGVWVFLLFFDRHRTASLSFASSYTIPTPTKPASPTPSTT